jgi:excisionase family DNA binding protein
MNAVTTSAGAAQTEPETTTEQSARIKRLLTMKDVAERLQVSGVTAWRLHAERGLRVVRIGRSVRVRESDLEAWLDKNASGGSEGGAEGGAR